VTSLRGRLDFSRIIGDFERFPSSLSLFRLSPALLALFDSGLGLARVDRLEADEFLLLVRLVWLVVRLLVRLVVRLVVRLLVRLVWLVRLCLDAGRPRGVLM